jgi:hypothetical protein
VDASRLVYVVPFSGVCGKIIVADKFIAEIMFLMEFRGSFSLGDADISLDYGAVWVDHVN